jgi:hypothetical protein
MKKFPRIDQVKRQCTYCLHPEIPKEIALRAHLKGDRKGLSRVVSLGRGDRLWILETHFDMWRPMNQLLQRPPFWPRLLSFHA